MSGLDHTKSEEQFQRACRSIPGGVNSPARAFGAVGGNPVIIDCGEGAFLTDVDGNSYLDYIGSWGPHLLGHQHPVVLAAVQEALVKGTSFGAPTTLESDLAEVVVDAVASVEKVRMVNSGTEATMSAIRLARGFTGRDKVIKFAGCYHGHVDSLLVQAGSGAMTHGTPSSPGVPAGCTQDTLALEFNDCQQLEDAFRKQGDQIACVILEPVVGNMGVVKGEQEFLQLIRKLCDEHGTIFIFDEVMTGFRLAYGGAQELLGVTPDMTTLGKILGGGMPVGAYGGRADIMETISPSGPVYQAGTLSGNPVAMACGLATLQTIRDSNPYVALEEQTQRLCKGLSQAATEAGIEHTIGQVGSMFTLFFNPEPVTNFTQACQCDTDRFGRYFRGMLERGVYLPCSQFEANFVSVKHTNEHIEKTIQAGREVFAELTSV